MSALDIKGRVRSDQCRKDHGLVLPRFFGPLSACVMMEVLTLLRDPIVVFVD